TKNNSMRIFTILALFVSFLSMSQDDIRYIYYDFEFKSGSTELMYGDNVVLRADEDAASNAIDTLRIGEAVEIIKQGKTTSTVNGRETHWYKVRAKNKVGYVLGGWIALDHK